MALFEIHYCWTIQTLTLILVNIVQAFHIILKSSFIKNNLLSVNNKNVIFIKKYCDNFILQLQFE